MVIEFKTVAKLVGIAVGAVAAMVVADKIIDKVYDKNQVEDASETSETEVSKETTKFVTRAAIALATIALVADRAIRIGLEFGAVAGTGIATRGHMTTDQLLVIVNDGKAFHSFMNEIWKVVRV